MCVYWYKLYGYLISKYWTQIYLSCIILSDNNTGYLLISIFDTALLFKILELYFYRMFLHYEL